MKFKERTFELHLQNLYDNCRHSALINKPEIYAPISTLMQLIEFYLDNQKGGGLTKREYFTGLAMQGIMAANPNSIRTNFQERASKAIEMADALIAELSKAKP